MQFIQTDAGLEAIRPGRLQHQRRDDGDEIGIAAAFADTVERALHMANASMDCRERVGDGLLRIVVCVNT